MIKLLLRTLILITVITFSFLAYVSYFGIETNKFNTLIKQKANETHEHIKVDFKRTKIHLNPNKLNLIIKLKESKILVKDNDIKLSKLNLYLPIKSFFNSDFLLNKVEIAFFENDIKDLTKITKLFLPRIINKKLNKVFEKGKLEGEFIVPFDSDGSMGKKYGFSGKISDATIKLTKDYSIKNFTTEIDYEKDSEGSVIKTEIKKGLFFDLELKDSILIIKPTESGNKINTVLYTNGKFNFDQAKKIASLLRFDITFLERIRCDC